MLGCFLLIACLQTIKNFFFRIILYFPTLDASYKFNLFWFPRSSTTRPFKSSRMATLEPISTWNRRWASKRKRLKESATGNYPIRAHRSYHSWLKSLEQQDVVHRFLCQSEKRQSLKWNWPSLKNKHRFESFRDLYSFFVAAFDERKKSMKELFAVKVASNSKTREKCISGRETRKFIVTRIRAASFVMNFDFWWFAKFVKSRKNWKFLFFCLQSQELAGRPDTAECSC